IVGDSGGGIYYNGGANHRILNSTISGNSAPFTGGGIILGGATLFVANSTISGNRVTSGGSAAGGIFIGGGSTATFRNSTITSNTTGGGGGGVQVNGTLNFGNTIIAGNSAPGNPDVLNFGGAVSAGNNLIGNTSTNVAIAYQMSDILNQTPMLGVLQNNGGPTPTHALLTGSPAIDAGDNAKAVDPFDSSTLTADQRGYAPRNVGGTVDIGAYEFNAAPTAAPVSVSGRVITPSGAGLKNATVQLIEADGSSQTTITSMFGYFQFDNVDAGESVVISIQSKRFHFTARVVALFDEITEVDFVGEDLVPRSENVPPSKAKASVSVRAN
ncbi:MAG: carboxypeptidase-like regulatory domain-containing protein, partial [Acidobacteriota bacterium]